jgi:Zinc-finger associated domain (zf-AD)
LNNSCRVCMQSSCELSSIYDEHEGKATSEVLTELSGVKIEEDDLLSKKICNVCLSKALEFLVFRQLCIDSDETVRYNLMLADGDESAIEVYDYVSEESLRNEETMQIEEDYYTEEDDVQYYNAESETAGFTEMFATEENATEDVLDSDDSSNEKGGISSKTKGEVPNDELTEKMREAHIAKEQQKKHKCPHCDKYFMFPSKGLIRIFR